MMIVKYICTKKIICCLRYIFYDVYEVNSMVYKEDSMMFMKKISSKKILCCLRISSYDVYGVYKEDSMKFMK